MRTGIKKLPWGGGGGGEGNGKGEGERKGEGPGVDMMNIKRLVL